MSRDWGDYGDDDGRAVARYEMWRQTVKNALAGKRGQAFLREFVAALDAMPEKRLIDGYLCQPIDPDKVEATPFIMPNERPDVCALGAYGRAKGVPDDLMMRRSFEEWDSGGWWDEDWGWCGGDPADLNDMAAFGNDTLGLARSLASEVAEQNDAGGPFETPEERWSRMREWALSHLGGAS